MKRLRVFVFTTLAAAGSALLAGAAPVNDNFADAITLSGASGALSGNTNVDATFETGEPVCAYAGSTNTVWFKWTSTESGTLTFSTAGSSSGGDEWDSVVGVYTGNSLAALTPAPPLTGAQDDGVPETLTINVTANTTYHFQLAGFQHPEYQPEVAVADNIALTWTFTAAPPPPPTIPELVSIDVVSSSSAVMSGDAAGAPVVGQVGPWNRLVGGTGAKTLTGLLDGGGAATTQGFTIGSASFQPGSNPATTGVVLASQNPERLWITGTSTLTFRFTGLTQGANYGVVVYNTGSPKTILTLNGVAHTNVATIFTRTETADASGEIVGVASFNGAAHSDYTELSGFQIYPLATPPVFTANAGTDQAVTPGGPSVQIGGSPAASGGVPPYTYSWSPATGLDDATIANPSAAPVGTTTYTLTVTDSTLATASDTVVVTYAGGSADLISIDAIANGSVAASGEVAGGLTGQAGPWNALGLTGGKVTLSNLKNGAGVATGTGFVFDATSGGYGVQAGGAPYNPGVVLASNNPERAWITGGHAPLTFKFTGLTVGGEYQLAIYSTGGANELKSYTINGTDYASPVDIHITTQTADANGEIVGLVKCAGSAYQWFSETAGFQLLSMGTPPSGYSAWATANAGGQSPSDDYDGDGVPNGVEYFMGATGPSLTANPTVQNGKVTWPHLATVSSFEVQVSEDLTIWTAAEARDVDTTTDPQAVIYSLPAGAAKKFCRLVVTP